MKTDTAVYSQSHHPSKALHISLWVVQVLLAAAFGLTGLMKIITPYAELAEQMPWVSAVPAFVPLLAGIAEFAAALGLILPAALRIKPVFTPLAAVGLLFVMMPAAFLHISRGEFDMVATTLILAGLAAFVAWGRTKRVPITPR